MRFNQIPHLKKGRKNLPTKSFKIFFLNKFLCISNIGYFNLIVFLHLQISFFQIESKSFLLLLLLLNSLIPFAVSAIVRIKIQEGFLKC